MFPWQKQFPFDQAGFTQHLNKMNPKDVENYIQTVMKNVFGGDFTQGFPFHSEFSQNDYSERPSKQTKPEIFETNDYVFVKLPFSKEDVENIKIQHTNNQLLIKIDSNELEDQTKIMLPSPVKRKGARAKYVEGYLEIQLIRLHEYSFSEVDIT